MLGILLSILATALSLLVVDIIFPGVVLANFPAALVESILPKNIPAFLLRIPPKARGISSQMFAKLRML